MSGPAALDRVRPRRPVAGQDQLPVETPGGSGHHEAMTTQTSPSERITAALTSWPGVQARPGRRGKFAFRVRRRELGHLRGDHAAHLSFPKAGWADLYSSGRIV